MFRDRSVGTSRSRYVVLVLREDACVIHENVLKRCQVLLDEVENDTGPYQGSEGLFGTGSVKTRQRSRKQSVKSISQRNSFDPVILVRDVQLNPAWLNLLSCLPCLNAARGLTQTKKQLRPLFESLRPDSFQLPPFVGHR
jgi:hypothetical protein